jgi:hypothetical protein
MTAMTTRLAYRSWIASLAICTLAALWGPHGSSRAQQTSEGEKTRDPGFVETGIHGVAFLDAASGERFIKANGAGTTADDGLMHHIYQDATGGILNLIQHPGALRYSFASARMLRAEAWPLGASPVDHKIFTSSKGVRLGMSTTELHRLLGRPTRTERAGPQRTAHHYFCDAVALCPSLGRYNMPSYSARAIFSGGRLVDYAFGFDYP